jgi:hypothetical protein
MRALLASAALRRWSGYRLKAVLKAILLCLLLLVVGGSVTPQAAAAPARAFKWHVPILTYHFTVCAPPGTPQGSRYLYVCPEVFKAQLQAVLNDGWTFITAAQFAALFVVGFHPWPKTVVLTIDGTEAADYEVPRTSRTTGCTTAA